MTLTPGTKLGQYEIISPLGAGGMGEVYRARDPRLRRDVAIKVLPSAVSADPERLRRFEEEACAAGALKDPHVLVVYDVGTHGGTPYIVSELLEGETLRDRLRSGPLPQAEAARYAAQIARGLAAAHDAGLVHRDLKPENLFLTKGDGVKILDFGLAKVARPAPAGELDMQAETLKLDTEPGTLLGTINYMSPEQAEGRPIDYRSDIFSFGAVFYEMLSGRQAFRGETQLDTLHSIRKEEPPELSAAGATVPPALKRIVRRCLEKKPERRFQSAHDLAFALEALTETARSGAGSPVPPAGRRRFGHEHVAWLLVGVLLAACLMFAKMYLQRAPTQARFLVHPPGKAVFVAGDFPNPVAVSPDGPQLALVVSDEAGTRIWLRPLDSLDATPLEKTEGAQNPFWSPDGRFIAFFAGGKLRKVAVPGGVPEDLCDAAMNTNYGTWGAKDVILFTKGNDGIHRVSAASREVKRVTKLDSDRHEIYHFWPEFLADGDHFIYLAGTAQDTILYVRSLSKKEEVTRLWQVNSRAVYAPPGYLLYLREGALLAHPFEVSPMGRASPRTSPSPSPTASATSAPSATPTSPSRPTARCWPIRPAPAPRASSRWTGAAKSLSRSACPTTISARASRPTVRNSPSAS